MPIELIKPTNDAPPVAMRFGTDIVTLSNIVTTKRATREAQAKAYILGAIECGLFEKQVFLDGNPQYTEETLETWKTLEEVTHILSVAKGELLENPETDSMEAQPNTVIILDDRPQLTEKTYVVGKWRLHIERNVLCHGVKEISLASSTVRALAMLFCNPGQWVTKGVLYQVIRNKPLVGRDSTVGAVFHDLQKTVEALGGPEYPIETMSDGLNYRIKLSK